MEKNKKILKKYLKNIKKYIDDYTKVIICNHIIFSSRDLLNEYKDDVLDAPKSEKWSLTLYKKYLSKIKDRHLLYIFVDDGFFDFLFLNYS